jgi:hypothetical protein
MDTLKGDWTWTKRYGGFIGTTIDNEFKSVIRILNQNEDGSINYQIFVEDTLFYEGAFQLQEGTWDCKTANIKLPYYTPSLLREGNWVIYLGDWQTHISSEDVLCFSEDYCCDQYIFFFFLIKEEE